MNNKFRPLAILFILIAFCIGTLLASPVRAVYGDCIAYDTFTGSDGALGNTETTGPSSEECPEYTWVGSTYAISSNTAVNAPTLGSEVLTNGNMETGNPPSSWSCNGATCTAAADERTGGSGSASFDLARLDADFPNSEQAFTSTLNAWYAISGWRKKFDTSDPNIAVRDTGGTYLFLPTEVSTTEWNQQYGTFRAISTSTKVRLLLGASGRPNGYHGRYDDLSIKPLTLSSLFATVSTSASDNLSAEVEATFSKYTRAGLVINLDSASTPLYYVIAYHDGVNMHLDKVMNGTPTVLVNTAATYAVGAKIKVTKIGTTYRVYYNGTQRGADQTIEDPEITGNTIHGMFATDQNNVLDNFHLMDFTVTPTPTNTSTATLTSTSTSTSTTTNTPTDTPTSTATDTSTPTNTSTETSTPTLTPTITRTPTITFTPSRTPYPTRTPANLATAFWDSAITYGETANVTATALLCLVVVIGLMAWLVTTYLQRRRR